MLPTEGHVILDTTNLSQISEQQRTLFRRKNIGIVFQRWNLLSHLTVAENLKLTHSTNGADSAESINNFNTQIEIELDKLDLKNRIHSPVSVLSEGEQQRIAVARVLLQKPTLLLADEPTSSLDQANSQIVIEGLLKSAGENTLLVVSHDHRIEKYFTTHIDLAEYK
jgi:putative ABC transport system ATP-binding protein